MPMEIDRRQLKQQAKQSMALAKPSFWLVTLVYFLMTSGVSMLADFTTGSLALFLSIALTMYGWVVGFSYRLWAIWTCRRLEPGLGSLTEGFSVAGRVIVMELGILGRLMCWTLLFSLLAGIVMMAAPHPITAVVMVSIAVIAVNVLSLRYSMAPYVLADYPQLGGAVAVVHSVRLTRGWVFELVKLHLSFFGWYLLSGVLAAAGMGLGMALSGDLSTLMTLSPDQLTAGLQTFMYAPLASGLGTLLSLPLALYFTPYLEVTLAEFYNARIALPDDVADPLAGTGFKMPPV